jgi:hypothetical protein
MQAIKLKTYADYMQVKADFDKLEKDGGKLPCYVCYGKGEEYVYKFDKIGDIETFCLYLVKAIKKCKGLVTISCCLRDEDLPAMETSRITFQIKALLYEAKLKGVKFRIVKTREYDWYEVQYK